MADDRTSEGALVDRVGWRSRGNHSVAVTTSASNLDSISSIQVACIHTTPRRPTPRSMSAQWSGTATAAAPPTLPAGAIAQANALSLPATVSPAAVQSPAPSASASVDIKPVIMSNGSIAPGALATPSPALSPAPPKAAVAPTVNVNGVYTRLWEGEERQTDDNRETRVITR